MDAASQIRAARERSNRALVSRDIRAFAASLAPNFVMITGDGSFVKSRHDYMDLFEAEFSDPSVASYERIPDKIEVSAVAPVAAEHGHWIATLPNGKRSCSGTYLAMWRQAGGEWKIRSELFVILK